jgi:hypothetical protein
MSDKMKLIMESWRSFSRKTLNENPFADAERELDADFYADREREIRTQEDSSVEQLQDRIETLIGSEGSSGQVSNMDYDMLGKLSDRVNASGRGRLAKSLRDKGEKPLSQDQISDLLNADDKSFIQQMKKILGGEGFDLSSIDRDGDGAISADQLRNIANAIA